MRRCCFACKRHLNFRLWLSLVILCIISIMQPAHHFNVAKLELLTHPYAFNKCRWNSRFTNVYFTFITTFLDESDKIIVKIVQLIFYLYTTVTKGFKIKKLIAKKYPTISSYFAENLEFLFFHFSSNSLTSGIS